MPLLGITHLIEHLALFPLSDREYEYNGMVSPMFTEFYCEGEPEEVVDFLNSVIDSLDHLNFDRLDDELRVLSIEMNDFGPSPFSFMAGARFGTTSLGVTHQPDFGAQNITRDDVERFRLQYFTRDNAVLFFSGEPPSGLQFDLPRGTPQRSQEITRIQHSFPARIEGPEDTIAVSFELPLNPSSSVLVRSLEQRLVKELRTNNGHSYNINGSFYGITTKHDYVFIEADIAPKDAETATKLFIDAIRDFVEHGPTREEVDAAKRFFTRLRKDPATIASQLMSEAEALLLDIYDPSQFEQSMSVDVEDLKVQASTILRSALFLLPCIPEDVNIYPAETSSNYAFTGTHHKAKRVYWVRPDIELVLNPKGISGLFEQGNEVISIAYGDVTMLAINESGNGIRIWNHEDLSLGFDDTVFPNGQAIIDEIKSNVPAELHARMPENVEVFSTKVEDLPKSTFLRPAPGTEIPIHERAVLPGAWIIFFAQLFIGGSSAEPTYPAWFDAIFTTWCIGILISIILPIAGFRWSTKVSLGTALFGAVLAVIDINYDPDVWMREFAGSLVLAGVSYWFGRHLASRASTPADTEA